AWVFSIRGSAQDRARTYFRQLTSQTTNLSSDNIEAMAVKTIQEAAAHDPLVGDDSLSICIWNDDPRVRVRYIPKEAKNIALHAGPEAETVPVAYCPWIVMPDIIVPPQMMYGNSLPELRGQFTVAFDSPYLEPLDSPIVGTETQ